MYFRPKGGKDCPGEKLDIQACHLRDCVEGTDKRSDFCKEMGKMKKQTYFAAPPNSVKPCELYCKRGFHDQTRAYVPMQRQVKDGTPCSYDNDNMFCMLGQCRRVGCDHTLDSVKKFNECGICGGDTNTDCNFWRFTKDKTATKGGSKTPVPHIHFNI